MSKQTILIVEDDAEIREGIRILLGGEGYHAIEASDGLEGLSMIDDSVDLVILDIMMPGMNGLKVCEEIRKFSNVPILFLTAKAQESDKLVGLMSGGDDYLSKPFSYSELIARVKALIRRFLVYQGRDSGGELLGGYIEYDNLRVAKDRNQVWIDGKEIDLTETEYKILLLLMGNPSRIFSAQNIYEAVWGEPYYFSCSNTINVHIRNLRTKVEDDPKAPDRIRTAWGKGYRYCRKSLLE